jgi:hypothetical protein
MFLNLVAKAKNVPQDPARSHFFPALVPPSLQSLTQSNACARARMALALGKLTFSCAVIGLTFINRACRQRTGTPKFRVSGCQFPQSQCHPSPRTGIALGTRLRCSFKFGNELVNIFRNASTGTTVIVQDLSTLSAKPVPPIRFSSSSIRRSARPSIRVIYTFRIYACY